MLTALTTRAGSPLALNRTSGRSSTSPPAARAYVGLELGEVPLEAGRGGRWRERSEDGRRVVPGHHNPSAERRETARWPTCRPWRSPASMSAGQFVPPYSRDAAAASAVVCRLPASFGKN